MRSRYFRGATHTDTPNAGKSQNKCVGFPLFNQGTTPGLRPRLASHGGRKGPMTTRDVGPRVAWPAARLGRGLTERRGSRLASPTATLPPRSPRTLETPRGPPNPHRPCSSGPCRLNTNCPCHPADRPRHRHEDLHGEAECRLPWRHAPPGKPGRARPSRRTLLPRKDVSRRLPGGRPAGGALPPRHDAPRRLQRRRSSRRTVQWYEVAWCRFRWGKAEGRSLRTARCAKRVASGAARAVVQPQLPGG